MSDSSQVQRQHFLLFVLADRKEGLTAKELLNYAKYGGYEVSSWTISRDIDDLSKNFPISESDSSGETRFYLESQLKGLIELNLDEMITLYYMREIVDAHASLDLATSTKYLINKLFSTLSHDKSEIISKFKDAIRVDQENANIDNTLDVSMLQKIRDAIASQNSIDICYHSFIKEEKSNRKVDPYFLELSDGNYKVVGHCYLRGCLRAFNVSRIETLKVLNETFKKPKNFYEEYVKGRFDKLSSDKKEKMKFRLWGNAAKLVKEYESKRADTITQEPDKMILFEKEAAITDDVVMWVLSYGDEIEVLEPIELREKVMGKAKGILKTYSKQT